MMYPSYSIIVYDVSIISISLRCIHCIKIWWKTLFVAYKMKKCEKIVLRSEAKSLYFVQCINQLRCKNTSPWLSLYYKTDTEVLWMITKFVTKYMKCRPKFYELSSYFYVRNLWWPKFYEVLRKTLLEYQCLD